MSRQRANVASGQHRNMRVQGIVGYDAPNVSPRGCQALPARRLAPHLHFGATTVEVSFDQHDSAMGEQGGQQGIGVRFGAARKIETDQLLGDDRRRTCPRPTMPIGVLAGRVEFMRVAAVFDRSDGDALLRQFSNQFDDQRRFAVVLSSDDMNQFHADGPAACRRLTLPKAARRAR